MKRQKIQLIVLLIICGVALAAYFGFKHYNDKQEAAADTTYTAYTVDTSQIQQIDCHNEAGSFTVARGDDDDSWVFPDHPDETVDTSQVESMLNLLSEIKSDNEVTNVTSPEDYGFGDDPTITIELTMKDGSKETLYVGSKNSTISAYYFRVGDSDTIYTVNTSFYSTFNLDHPSLVSTDSTSSSSTEQPTEAVSSSSAS